MKIKLLIPVFVAAITAVFTGCSENNDPTYLSQIRVSQSYVGIPAGGGTVNVDVTAGSSWSVKDDPSYSKWLTITPAQGSAGKTTMSFSAEAATETQSATVVLECEGQTQEINVLQVTEKVELPISTCAEIVAGEDGKTFRAKGVCTAIANTTYGNWYLNDGTEEVYIYGTLDAKGAEKNFLSLGIEVGDVITVEGPKTTYNGTVELVNVTVINIEKSLIKCDSLMVNGIKGDELPVEGGEFEAMLTNKGLGISVDVPADAQSWLSVLGVQTSGNTSVVKFRAAANEGGDRSTTLTFKTTDGSKEYSSQATISQKGAIVECNVAQFLAAPVSNSQYRVTGVIQSVANASYGNIYIKDFSGEAYVYGIGAKGDFEAKGLKVGDIVTLVGKRGEYKGTAQMTGAQLEKVIPVTEVTIAEFLSKPDDKNTYYMVKGTISSLKGSNGKDNDYGNLYLTDGTNELYVYGCYAGWGATGNDRKFFIADNNIKVGDELTMIGYKDTYNGLVELCGGINFSFKHAE